MALTQHKCYIYCRVGQLRTLYRKTCRSDPCLETTLFLEEPYLYASICYFLNVVSCRCTKCTDLDHQTLRTSKPLNNFLQYNWTDSTHVHTTKVIFSETSCFYRIESLGMNSVSLRLVVWLKKSELMSSVVSVGSRLAAPVKVRVLLCSSSRSLEGER
jgi:hypothetical protein